MPTQGMSDIMKEFAHVTGLTPEQFRIHAKDVGGGFGVRNEVYPEFAALAFAARALDRPVKWTGTRSESLLSDHHGRGVTLSGELALDRDGNFLGMRIEWLVDVGAYSSNAGPFTNTAAAPTSMAANVYRTPAVYGLNRLVFTNATPTAPYRGAGRPSVSYLAERLVDEAARLTGIDRIELRRRNLLTKESFPYKTPTGATYDSGDPATLLEEVLRVADWDGFERRRTEAKKRGKLRGIGCAIFIEPSGGLGQEEIVNQVRRQRPAAAFHSGGAVRAGARDRVSRSRRRHSRHVGGQDHAAGERSGRAAARRHRLVRLALARSAMAARCRSARTRSCKKGLALAAKELEVAATDIVFEKGRYRVPGTDLSVSLEDLAKKHVGGESHPLDAVAKIATAAAFPSGAHVAEVEIDPETGVIELLRYVAVDDCGNIYNHTLVEGQLLGGIMQGLGQIFGEHCVYDSESGQFLTGTFMDYYMPRADILPEFSLHDRPTPSPSNPLGAKGAGEAGTTGSIPTVANAVMDALEPLGIHHLDMPYTPSQGVGGHSGERQGLTRQGLTRQGLTRQVLMRHELTVRVLRSRRHSATFTPVTRTTSAHFGISCWMMAANSAGVVIFGSMPSLAKLARSSGDFNPSLIAALSLSITAAGVPGRRHHAEVDVVGLHPGIPASTKVGTSGSSGQRSAAVTASARTLPAWMCGSSTDLPLIVMSIWPAIRSEIIGAPPR